MEAASGVTLILTSVAGVTMSEYTAHKLPCDAVIVAVPCFKPVASPAELIDTTVESDEDQATELVITLLVPSVKLPVATNCSLNPNALLVRLEVTVMLCNLGLSEAVTVPMDVLTPAKESCVFRFAEACEALMSSCTPAVVTIRLVKASCVMGPLLVTRLVDATFALESMAVTELGILMTPLTLPSLRLCRNCATTATVGSMTTDR